MKRRKLRKLRRLIKMKTKRVLFLISGVFNTILGGISAFIGLLILMCNSVLKETFNTSYNMVESYIKALAEQDASYEYLLDVSKSEAIDFMMTLLIGVSIIFVLVGAVYITFGVLNLLLSKRDSTILKRKKHLGTVLVVFSWLIMWFNVFNILTTVAVYLKSKEDKNIPTKLYSVSDNT